ncbi:MAG: adenosine deaminase [Dinoroseobacter sp.]|nr:adenosine deaminase [Dinoroseobacter sp.]
MTRTADIPKVELHLHLEGAAPPAFIRGLAQEKRVDISGIFDESGGYKFEGFVPFLRTYEAACTVLQNPQDFYRLTKAVLEQSAAHGVIYSETFVSPDFCGGNDVEAWKDYMAAIQQAATEAEDSDGIILRGVLTCIRHEGPENAKLAARCAQETAGDWLVGYGMGGDENQFSQADFRYSFDMAREAGLRLTTHAGEWCGAKEVREAIRDLGVERIGHGVGAIEDMQLVEELAENGVVLEVCPGSNVALGVVKSWAHHPIERLRAEGVKVTVSTDDPPFFHTTMSHEYEKLADTFGWDEARFAEVNRAAIEAAFCDDATRARVLKRLET